MYVFPLKYTVILTKMQYCIITFFLFKILLFFSYFCLNNKRHGILSYPLERAEFYYSHREEKRETLSN